MSAALVIGKGPAVEVPTEVGRAQVAAMLRQDEPWRTHEQEEEQ